MKQERTLISLGCLIIVAGLVGNATPGRAQVSYQRLKSFGFQQRLSGVCSEGALIEGADGALYGTTYTGGTQGRGTVFRLNKDGTGQTVLRDFTGGPGDGAHPKAGLAQGKDGSFYGTTFSGGDGARYGTVYKLKGDGSGFAILKSFAGASGEGAYPLAGVVQGSNGVFYGMTYAGGVSNRGSIFRVNPDGSGFSYLHGFTGVSGDGAYPVSTLVQSKDGWLYATTYGGGGNSVGMMFKIQLNGTGFTNLHTFAGGAQDGAFPLGPLALGNDGVTLYGTTFNGGAQNKGVLFKRFVDGSFTLLHTFSGIGEDGAFPAAGVRRGAGELTVGTTMSGGDFANGTIFTLNADGTGFALLRGFFGGGEGLPQGLLIGSDGELYGTAVNDEQAKNGTVFNFNLSDSSYTVLEDFSGTDADGSEPSAALVQGSDGALYGTAFSGGLFGNGTVYKVNRDGGDYAILKNFLGTGGEGANPGAALLPGGPNGELFGTTTAGGNAQGGTVFAIAPDGSDYLNLHAFLGGKTDGANPHAGLAWGPDGLLYGTTPSGGASSNGVAFALSPAGASFKIVKSFSGGANDGAQPEAALLLGNDAAFYGTTVEGGNQNSGTVFRLGTNGNSTLLASLPKTAGGGVNPQDSLLQASDGALYGTAANGGSTAGGALFKLNLDGNGFTNIYSFQGLEGEGSNPLSSLIEGKDGFLYGTASAGGVNNGGTVFRVAKNGSGFTPLHAFTGSQGDGADPEAALFQTSDGLLFGTTVSGGDADQGTLFVLSATTPTNDAFAKRIVLPNTHPTSQGNNFNAGSEPSEPVHSDGASPATNSIWWSWTAPSTGPVTVLTDGSSFETIIDVYTGSSVSGLSLVASSSASSTSAISNRLNFTASAGVSYQVAISGTNSGFVNLSVQTVSLVVQNLIRTSNQDGTTSFSSNIKIGNSSGVSSRALRLRVVARAGYSTLEGSPDPGLPPADQDLGLFKLSNPASLPSGSTASVPVSVVCPPPLVIDPQKVGFGWGVFAVLEEQTGTNWFPKDKDLLGYGVWPTIGGFVGPGGGVIRINPAVSSSSFNPVSLSRVSIFGPSVVDAGSSASFYGAATFDNGSIDYFTNTTWKVSPTSAGTIGSNGKFQAANVSSDTPATITGFYFYDATNAASRSITVHALPIPVITTQPADQTVRAGSNAVFQVVATGASPLRYQWFFAGNSLAGATTNTLHLSDVQLSQAGSYFVIVTNTSGSATSGVAQLTVLSAPLITTQPNSQTVRAGTNLTLHVVASGTAPLAYQWFVTGAAVAGATTDTLIRTNVQNGQAGSYFVIITNSIGSVTSAVAQVTVLSAPLITTQPSSQTVRAGTNLTLHVVASGTAPLAYQWFVTGAAVAGATTDTLIRTNVQSAQAGSYFVIITNSIGSVTSAVAQVTVLSAPLITTQPNSQTVRAGTNLTLHVVASGTAPLAYQWFVTGAAVAGATTDTLVRTNVQNGQAGSYFVIITNSIGSVTSAVAQVTVLSAPLITTQPTSQTLRAGTNLTLHVVASGTAPLSYQWFQTGAAVAGATTDTLIRTNVQNGQAGSYFVIITNSVGSVTSTVAQVVVLVPPGITSQPTNQSVVVGHTVHFQVVASGTTPLSYQWFRSGSLLSGATSDLLTLTNIQPSQAGAYSVTITNTAGKITSGAAQLTVLVPPNLSLIRTGVTASGVSITLTSITGLTYALEYKKALSDSAWTSLLPAIPGTGQIITLRDTNSPALSARFYRVLTK